MRLLVAQLVAAMALVALFYAGPVLAATFEFHYFESDKMTYEVGEAIHMTAKITADFSESGWCHVLFSVSTTQGTAFQDGYYIPSSPIPQYPASTYVVRPTDVSPGVEGETATLIFNYDFYDERFSQAGAQSIVVNITRGALTIEPLSNLTVETESVLKIRLRVVSVHSSEVVMMNEPVVLSVRNSSEVLFRKTTLSNDDGIAATNWSTDGIMPGLYNLTIETYGNEDFLPTTRSFDIEVLPASSSIEIIDAPAKAYCQADDDNIYDYANLSIRHVDNEYRPINGSRVYWEIEGSQGNFTFTNGTYTAMVPLRYGPGPCSINVTAENSLYRPAHAIVNLTLVPRPLSVSWNLETYAIAGQSFGVEVALHDAITGISVTSAIVNLSLSVGSETIVSEGSPDAFGVLAVSFNIPSSSWGIASLCVEVDGSPHYESYSECRSLVVLFNATIDACLLTPVVLDQVAKLACHISNPVSNDLAGVRVELWDTSKHCIVAGTTNITGWVMLQWHVNASPFSQVAYTVRLPANESAYMAPTALVVDASVRVPVSLVHSSQSIEWDRGKNVSLPVTLQSSYLENGSVSIMITSACLPPLNLTVPINMTRYATFSLTSDFPIGPYRISITLTNDSLYPIGDFTLEVVVMGHVVSTVNNILAFFSETMNISLLAHDEIGEPISFLTISFYIDGLLLTQENSTTGVYIELSLSLPTSVSPGPHNVTVLLESPWLHVSELAMEVLVWIRTSIDLNVDVPGSTAASSSQESAPSISSGSIILPPPTLFNGTTSAVSPTALETSRDSCPRLSSGTNNLSTVAANSLTILSGNGQSILNRRDLNLLLSFNWASSTARDVLPNDMIPHCERSGPDTTTSVSACRACDIFLSSRRTRRSCTSGSAVFRNPNSS